MDWMMDEWMDEWMGLDGIGRGWIGWDWMDWMEVDMYWIVF
jgi:hypothetical protein